MEWITLAWKYRNEIGIVCLCLVLVTGVFYIKHVFNDRDTLKQEVSLLRTELDAVKKQVTLNEDIAHAISRIKIQSNNYVNTIENGKPDTTKPVVLIPSGMFLPPVYSAYSSAR